MHPAPWIVAVVPGSWPCSVKLRAAFLIVSQHQPAREAQAAVIAIARRRGSGLDAARNGVGEADRLEQRQHRWMRSRSFSPSGCSGPSSPDAPGRMSSAVPPAWRARLAPADRRERVGDVQPLAHRHAAHASPLCEISGVS
jgi:hypothetical protein